MEEPVRLACPECNLVYRAKKLTLGKNYTCKNCGSGLLTVGPRPLVCPSCGAAAEAEGFDPSHPPHCPHCTPSPALVLVEDAGSDSGFESSIARENRTALSAAHAAIPDRSGRTSSRQRASASGGEMERLPRLLTELNARLEALQSAEAEKAPDEAGENSRRLLALSEELRDSINTFREGLEGGIHGLDAKVTEVLERLDKDGLAAISQQVRESGDLFLARLGEYQAAQKKELENLRESGTAAATGSGELQEINIDELTERLVAGVRGIAPPRLGAESGSAVDALARVADGLVREQSANSVRLDQLAGEIKSAVAKISSLDEWRGDLASRVADQIGVAVEERVVGPVSGALARQAPAILSEMQDNKLVDIVSRSVREAQRPLLREILTGGRGGVPIWLFASVLIPLLLILGYLFLPGELGLDDRGAVMNKIAGGVAAMENSGVPLTQENADRLRNIEDVVVDLHRAALAHAKNAAALEEQVKYLNQSLAEKAALLQDYERVLPRETSRANAYKTRLAQLGVDAESIKY